MWHGLIHLLNLDRSEQHLVVIFRNQGRDLSSDVFNGFLAIQGWLRKHILEMMQKLLFYFFMCFQIYSLGIAEDGDAVGHSSLYGRSMEEGSILLSFFKPSYFGFLFSEHIFLKFLFLDP